MLLERWRVPLDFTGRRSGGRTRARLMGSRLRCHVGQVRPGRRVAASRTAVLRSALAVQLCMFAICTDGHAYANNHYLAARGVVRGPARTLDSVPERCAGVFIMIQRSPVPSKYSGRDRSVTAGSKSASCRRGSMGARGRICPPLHPEFIQVQIIGVFSVLLSSVAFCSNYLAATPAGFFKIIPWFDGMFFTWPSQIHLPS